MSGFAESGKGGFRVLCVEDDPDDWFLIQDYLRVVDEPAVAMTHTEALAPALRLLETESFDVVLVDLSLPDSQGLETVRSLLPAAGSAPVVVLTGLEDHEVAAQSLREGAQDYLVKEWIDTDLLVRTLIYAVERRRVEEELRRRLGQQQVVARLAIEVSGAGSLSEVLELGCRRVAETLGAETAVVVRQVGSETSPVVSQVYGLDKSIVGSTIEYADREILSRQAGAAGAVNVDLEETGAPSYLEAAGMRYGLIAPIPAGSETYGVLAAYSARPFLFSEADAAFLELSASLMGLTQQRLVEHERWVEQQRVFRTMVQTIETGLVGTAADGTITFANPKARRLLGLEEVARSDLELLSFVPDPRHREPLKKALRSPVGHNDLEIRLERPDGRRFWAHAHTVGFSDPSTPTTRALTTLVDIDVRKSLEERIRRSQKMEAIGRLAGGVAHDFNNLLTVICGNAELLDRLLRVDGTEKQQSHLAEVIDAADKATSVTNQMLAISRQQVARVQTVVINDSISSLQKILRRLLDATFELQLDLADDLHPVLIDPGHVEQILLNLVVNARDAMSSGGVVRVSTRNLDVDQPEPGLPSDLEPGRYAVLEVSDQGAGIDEDIVERVFEPFFTTKGDGEGTGLGLSIVYGLVTQSRGRIDVAATGSTGTTLRVFLPATEVEAKPKPVLSEALKTGGATILLVEDERSLRRVARSMLEALGFKSLTAANGEEALELCDDQGDTIDCVLADMVMPKMGGVELLEKLRERRPGLPVALMTGYGDLADPASSLGVEILEKPFNLRSLSSVLSSVLESRQPATEESS